MPVAVTKYKACDGSEWTTEADALSREEIVSQVKAAMSPLGDEIRGCDFQNGGGYIQHSAEAVKSARLAIHEIAKSGPLKWWIDKQRTDHGKSDESLALEVHPSWHLRMLDGGCAPLELAYCRISCIDTATNREYGQPYFAAHPNEAEQVELRFGKGG